MSIPASAEPSFPSDPAIEPSVNTELTRLGNTKQCPICGSEVHEDAYHCNKCRSFFCYHCRAHLVADEPILQCSNQDCRYYGKWVCGVCNPVSKKQEKPLEYIEPVDGYWPAWLVISIVLSMIVGWYLGWKSAMIAFLGLYPGLGFVLQSMDINIFGKQRKVVMDRTSEVHSCICCSKSTKKTSLRQSAG